MADWTNGYVADIGYTYGYYKELNPLRARLAFLNSGLVPPSEGGVHCELGFGQGISTNIHAAASNSTWYANDFNPAQASFAQEVATASGANAHLSDESFADFCARDDLPVFDSIGLHGIWSWINDENRTVIVDFIKRKLKVGGALYISYNTQPGWAAMAPMRDLLTEHSDVMGVAGTGIISRIDSALEFADKLMGTNPAYLRAHPSVTAQLERMKAHDRNYLAHEYFNHDWLPMPFSKMAQWLEPAKVDFACSTDYLLHVNTVNYTPEQLALIREVPDPMFRETVRDFILNQQFRKDYWVKGARKLTPLEQAQGFRALNVMLAVPRDNVSLTVKGALGEATLQEAVYKPILDLLADYKPKTLGQIEQALKGREINFSHIVEAVLLLAASATLDLVQSEALVLRAKKHTGKLNVWLMNKSRSSGEVNYLASPVTGGGISVGRFHQLFLLAISQGHKQPAELAKFTWDLLKIQGSKLVKEGKTLETPEENIAELTTQAEEFATKRLPVLKALQVI
ncbi:MAG: class I SAM-dependent methyltransferase [Burkholderiaceae bacterium]|nr:class I SAM-dependent methyltransferase [Burkholderiaceae bacterium]